MKRKEEMEEKKEEERKKAKKDPSVTTVTHTLDTMLALPSTSRCTC